MGDAVVTDELWVRLESLIPVPETLPHPGRYRSDSRTALEGILYVVRTGIGRNQSPTGSFGVSVATCWRRLSEWSQAGVWQQASPDALLSPACSAICLRKLIPN
ncbi:transposase [Nocardia sp. NBC_01329]|uniref:transposase n=1 Tax=Nocardia sp. NBC_01329 TaxID=2903594 RepID=UPI003FA380B2